VSDNSTLNKLGDVPFLLSGVRTFSIKEPPKVESLGKFFSRVPSMPSAGATKEDLNFFNEKIVCKALKTKY